jgi:hypothetical protein
LSIFHYKKIQAGTNVICKRLQTLEDSALFKPGIVAASPPLDFWRLDPFKVETAQELSFRGCNLYPAKIFHAPHFCTGALFGFSGTPLLPPFSLSF